MKASNSLSLTLKERWPISIRAEKLYIFLSDCDSFKATLFNGVQIYVSDLMIVRHQLSLLCSTCVREYVSESHFHLVALSLDQFCTLC